MNDLPYVFTFYSYKGGVGRSMALINVAYRLASWGMKVLVVDMDIEAPGISGFLTRHDELIGPSAQDVVDLLHWAEEWSQRPDATDLEAIRAEAPPLAAFCSTVKPERLIKPRFGPPGRIDVIAAHEEIAYVTRYSRLRLGDYTRDEIIGVAGALRRYLRMQRLPIDDLPDYYPPEFPREEPYDYILVDSRTGLTDIGGLCIGPLSDHLVVFTGLNDQNIEGTRHFMDAVGLVPNKQYKPPRGKDTRADGEQPAMLGPKPTLLVASPVPHGEMDFRERRVKQIRQRLGPVAATLTYHPRVALLETIFVRQYPKEYLSREYDELTGIVTSAAHDLLPPPDSKMAEFSASLAPSPNRPVKPVADSDAADLIRQVLRAGACEPATAVGTLNLALASWQPGGPAALACYDLACRRLDAYQPLSAEVLANWADAMEDWEHAPRISVIDGVRTQQLRILDRLIQADLPRGWRADVLFNKAVILSRQGDQVGALAAYEAVLAMPDAPAEHRAEALVNKGWRIGRQGDEAGELAAYEAVLGMPDAPAKHRAQALVNKGWRLGEQGDEVGALAAYEAVLAMPDAPAEPRAMALVNQGVRLGQQGDEAGELAAYEAVLAMPDAPAEQRARALGNTSWRHYTEGRFAQAAEAARLGVDADASLPWIRANLAIALLHLGRSDDALAEYRPALTQIAKEADLDRIVVIDLNDALSRNPALPGAREALDLAETRRRELRGEPATPPAAPPPPPPATSPD